MNRQEIIADLLACLKAIGPATGFGIAPAGVRRGIHLASEASDLPALSLYNQRVETADGTEATTERLIVLHRWGAVHAQGGDYGDLDRLGRGLRGGPGTAGPQPPLAAHRLRPPGAV